MLKKNMLGIYLSALVLCQLACGEDVDDMKRLEAYGPVEFRNKTLAYIADELNRYNPKRKLKIEGEALRNRRFLLLLNSPDPQSLVTYLVGEISLDVVFEGDYIIVRERRKSERLP